MHSQSLVIRGCDVLGRWLDGFVTGLLAYAHQRLDAARELGPFLAHAAGFLPTAFREGVYAASPALGPQLLARQQAGRFEAVERCVDGAVRESQVAIGGARDGSRERV